MRTNIVIDDKLMADALKATGLNTKKEAVEQGLRLLIQRNKQQAIRKLRGKLRWEGSNYLRVNPSQSNKELHA